LNKYKIEKIHHNVGELEAHKKSSKRLEVKNPQILVVESAKQIFHQSL
jgi:hypothetical protein